MWFRDTVSCWKDIGPWLWYSYRCLGSIFMKFSPVKCILCDESILVDWILPCNDGRIWWWNHCLYFRWCWWNCSRERKFDQHIVQGIVTRERDEFHSVTKWPIVSTTFFQRQSIQLSFVSFSPWKEDWEKEERKERRKVSLLTIIRCSTVYWFGWNTGIFTIVSSNLDTIISKLE